MAAWRTTRFTERLALTHPIVQGPFGGGLSSPALAAAVSNLGGLGSYGAQGHTPERIHEVAAAIRVLTKRPFAVNLWVSTEDEGARAVSEVQFLASHAPLLPLYRELGVEPPAYDPLPAPPFEQHDQGHGNIVGEIAGGLRVERLIDHRLRQPLADIKLAPRLGRFHPVETQSRHYGAEIAPRPDDRGAVGRMPAQIGILHHILGLGARTEHAIGETDERAPMRLERLHFLVGHDAHAAWFMRYDSCGVVHAVRFMPPDSWRAAPAAARRRR